MTGHILKWLLIGSITIVIPDSKDAIVVGAKNLYNARTGSSLNTTQYVTRIAINGIVNEYALSTQGAAATTSNTAEASAQATISAAASQAQATITASQDGWNTPTPTP